MTIENTPATGTGEVSADESYEAYEARRNAERSGSDKAGPSDVAEPVADSDDKTALDSETEDDTEQEKDENEEDGDKKPVKRGGFQRRIDKLTARIKELEATKTLADKSAGASSEAKTATPAAAVVETTAAKPRMEDFDSIEDFTEALTDWKLEAKERERTESAKAEAAKAEAQTLIDGWNARVSDAKKAHPDYDSVMDEASDIQISPAHQRLFLDSEVGAQIAYDLASDHEALEHFASLPPLAAAKLFGQLEAALGKPAQRKPPAPTRAPRPPSTVQNRGGSVDTAPSADDDYETWERKRLAQLRRR